MSDPTQPAPADPAAPIVQPPAAPVVAPAAAPPAAPPARVLNPYAVPPQRPPAPAAAQPTPAAPEATQPPADPAIAAMQADLARLRGIVGEDVTRDLAAASDGVRASVLALAGDDPLEQRRVLATLRANGVAGPVTLPPGASTAVPTQQPTPAVVASPDATALAHYDGLIAKDAHIAAAAYASVHAPAIARARAARPS